jgi:thiamine biosynthesis lipoprotein
MTKYKLKKNCVKRLSVTQLVSFCVLRFTAVKPMTLDDLSRATVGRITGFFGIGCLVLGILAGGCQDKQLYKEQRVMMGTYVEVISPEERAIEIAFKEIKRIENLLSRYNPESEVFQLNETGELGSSPETFAIVKKAKEFWEATSGAFDITVAPLMDLWGFTEKEYLVPGPQQIKNALELIGSDKIALNETDNVIKFLVPGMKIDLGAVAKGYSIDGAVKKLKEAGVKSCLINAGGDVYGLGEKFGSAWKVAVQDPYDAGSLDTIELKNQCVATSGDYEQLFTRDDKTYSHIMNPQTGSPADSGLISVTVTASDCLTADALATSVFVLGKKKGKALAGRFADVKIDFVKHKGYVQDN